jgi:hypothetical protein
MAASTMSVGHVPAPGVVSSRIMAALARRAFCARMALFRHRNRGRSGAWRLGERRLHEGRILVRRDHDR